MFYQDLFNCLLAWGRSRRWRKLFWLAALPALLFWSVLGLVVYGASLGRQELAARYLELVQEDVEAGILEAEGKIDTASDKDDSADGAKSEQETGNASNVASQRVLVPLRKMLQLGNSNEKVIYLVGIAMARQGRLAMATQILKELAPASGGGLPPAHAFMAQNLMASWKGTESEAEVLLAHLQTAERGGVKLSTAQLSNHAALLNRLGRGQEAINMLQQHTAEHPELNLLITQIDAQSGEKGSDSRAAVDAARTHFKNKYKEGKATFDDFKLAIMIEVDDGQLDQARKLAHAGYEQQAKSSDQNTKLLAARMFSDVLLLKHRDVTEKRKEELVRAERLRAAPPPMDLRYLELACEVDSANPSTSEELAKLMFMGQSLTPEMQKLLEQSIVEGTATGVTHLILANRRLTSDQPHTALPELRLSLRKMPNSPIVMNNLAYAILKYDTQKIPEAKELIERALSIPGASQADRASMFDTLAEIRLALGDDLGAIEMFEEAIKHDGSKVGTRKKLAEVYNKVGMQDLAKGQLAKIKQLSEQ